MPFRLNFAVAVVVASFATTSCREAIPSRASAPSPTLQTVFNGDLIHEQVKYFESQVGPAIHLSGDGSWRTYKVSNCSIAIRVSADEITAARFELTPGCDVDLNRIVKRYRFPAWRNLTFGDFGQIVRVSGHGADCILNCNAGVDHGIYAWSSGSHNNDDVDILISADLRDPQASRAVDEWTATLIHSHGAEWVTEKGFNCDASSIFGVPKELSALRIRMVTVGINLAKPEGFCRDKSETREALPMDKDNYPDMTHSNDASILGSATFNASGS